MPVLGELLSRFVSEATIRKMLAQGFAPGFPVPEKFVADVKQLTYTAFRTAHDDSIAYETEKPVVERLATRRTARDLRLAGCACRARSAKLLSACPAPRSWSSTVQAIHQWSRRPRKRSR